MSLGVSIKSITQQSIIMRVLIGWMFPTFMWRVFWGQANCLNIINQFNKWEWKSNCNHLTSLSQDLLIKCFTLQPRSLYCSVTSKCTVFAHHSISEASDSVWWSNGHLPSWSSGRMCQGSRFCQPCYCWDVKPSWCCWTLNACHTRSVRRRCQWCTPKKLIRIIL